MDKEERINEIEVAAIIEGVLKIFETIKSDSTRMVHNLDASEIELNDALGKLLKGAE